MKLLITLYMKFGLSPIFAFKRLDNRCLKNKIYFVKIFFEKRVKNSFFFANFVKLCSMNAIFVEERFSLPKKS